MLERIAACDDAPADERRVAVGEALALRRRLAAALPELPVHAERLAAWERLAGTPAAGS